MSENETGLVVPDTKGDATVSEKLDEILAILKERRESEKDVKDKIRDEIVEYMLKHFNISWLDDTVEKNVYDGFFDILFGLLDKYLPF